MTIGELKKYIYDNNKIECVLQSIGCSDIVYHEAKEYYSCSNKDGDNKGAINVKNNEYLNVINWTRSKDFDSNSDLITLVQYNEKLSFIDTIKFIHKVLGLKFELTRNEKQEKKFNPLHVFEKHRSNRKVVNVDDIQVLSDELLNDYVPMLHINWFKEGIVEKTRKKFNIAYSYRRKRIIIPHFYWMTNELIGVQARTTVENYAEFAIPKYLLTNGLDKSLNVYGYCQNKYEIEKRGYCCIYESEKSVLKRDSRLDPTGLALSGKFISEEQVRIILSLDVNEIVIAMDSDVVEEEVWHICSKFYRHRKVSYIYDKWDLLKEKEAPADASNKIYKFLFDHRIKYDDNEHEQYLKSLKK